MLISLIMQELLDLRRELLNPKPAASSLIGVEAGHWLK